jgi:3-oxoacyl-[acyl-carrier protein] reductase
MGSDFEKAMIAGTPLGRIGQPDDIARVAVFLASAAWLTGERLTASGGYRGRNGLFRRYLQSTNLSRL